MKPVKRNRCLIKPDNALPPEWPTAWEFPSLVWPPGYPKTGPEKVHLVAIYNQPILTVQVMNEYQEIVDELDGYFVRVKGVDVDRLVRLQEPGASKWFELGIFQIKNCGVTIDLDFEVERVQSERFFIEIGLFGCDEKFGTIIEVGNASIPS